MARSTGLVTVSKISVSVPKALADDLVFLSSRLGVSRSALISGLLEQAVPEMRALLAVVPANSSDTDALRMRGESEALVRARIEHLQALADSTYGEGSN